MSINRAIAIGFVTLLTSACAGKLPDPKDYSSFYRENPRSVLVVPVINHSNEAQAADLFLTTLAVPLSERGYYVFPTNMSKKLIENDGMSDPGVIHSAQTPAIARLFGADTVLYIEILDWKSKYVLTASNVEVKFLYTLKSGKTGDLLWQEERGYVYSSSSNSGNFLADIVVNAVKSMIDNGRADYTPVAMQANAIALLPAGQGVPFGPYNPNNKSNEKLFPSTGTGKATNATTSAISWPTAPPAPSTESVAPAKPK